MSEGITSRSIRSFFRFPFEGPGWQGRLVVGVALTFAGSVIPIVPFIFVGGYVLQVMRQAIEGEDLALPGWDDWGRLGKDGLRGMLVSLVYMLPGVAVWAGGMILYFASSFAFMLPAEAGMEGGEVPSGAPLLFLAGFAILFLSMFAGWALSLLGTVPLPMATAHFVAKDELAAAFRVGEWWLLIRANKLAYLIDWVIVAGLATMGYAACMVAYMSVVMCCVLPLLTAPIGFYMALVGAALFGETYRESVAMLRPGDQAADDE